MPMEKPSRVKAVASFLFKLLRVLIVLGIAFALAFWLYASRSTPEKKELVRIMACVTGHNGFDIVLFKYLIQTMYDGK